MADFFIIGCGLRRLHDTRLQNFIRGALDEIDFQCLRDEHPCPEFVDRVEMFGFINASVVKQGAIDFIEFGVYRGDSIREWSTMNSNPTSRFYGFDSFEGLPEEWRAGQGRGHFDVGGSIPQMADGRVKFIKGWFDKTVPDFVRDFAPRDRLVLHLDADLYASTMIPLIYFSRFLRAGSLLIFDEFYDRNHEFKAFHDFLKINRANYRILCQMSNYGRVCIELV